MRHAIYDYDNQRWDTVNLDTDERIVGNYYSTDTGVLYERIGNDYRNADIDDVVRAIRAERH